MILGSVMTSLLLLFSWLSLLPWFSGNFLIGVSVDVVGGIYSLFVAKSRVVLISPWA
jgi:hypothetical protein